MFGEITAYKRHPMHKMRQQPEKLIYSGADADFHIILLMWDKAFKGIDNISALYSFCVTERLLPQQSKQRLPVHRKCMAADASVKVECGQLFIVRVQQHRVIGNLFKRLMKHELLLIRCTI